jgi:transcriptional regulator with XRE-family HTH domain
MPTTTPKNGRSSPIRKLRMKAKLSQSQLARKAELDRGTISNAEKGNKLSELTLEKLASVFSEELKQVIEADDLLG